MRTELNQNISTMIFGFRFAIASLFLILLNNKSEYWLRKKAKYARNLINMFEIENSISVQPKSKQKKISGTQPAKVKQTNNVRNPQILNISDYSIRTANSTANS